ncbi:MAG: hypothetical protein IKC94_01030 [Lentisphaeria bacterium]|nr:hypothetical protein [Lentisphaeria bacterium]
MTSLSAGEIGAFCADFCASLIFAAYGGDQRSAVGSRPGKHPAAKFFYLIIIFSSNDCRTKAVDAVCDNIAAKSR